MAEEYGSNLDDLIQSLASNDDETFWQNSQFLYDFPPNEHAATQVDPQLEPSAALGNVDAAPCCQCFSDMLSLIEAQQK
jgi:hypothetical protein